jgi:DNA topoisomerase IA
MWPHGSDPMRDIKEGFKQQRRDEREDRIEAGRARRERWLIVGTWVSALAAITAAAAAVITIINR